MRLIIAEVEKGLRQRYTHAAGVRKHAGESVEKGREYVAAYIEFMHYAERLLQDATSAASHAEAGAAEAIPKAAPHKH